MNLRLIALLLSLLACALPMAARAQVCNIVTTSSDMAFGTYDPGRAGFTDINGSVQVQCANQRSVTVALGVGGGSLTTRQMRNGIIDTLDYNLYKDASRTTVFGTAGAATMTCTAGDSTGGCTGGQNSRYWVNFPIYGRIFPGQYVAAGSYSDDVPITITF